MTRNYLYESSIRLARETFEITLTWFKNKFVLAQLTKSRTQYHNKNILKNSKKKSCRKNVKLATILSREKRKSRCLGTMILLETSDHVKQYISIFISCKGVICKFAVPQDVYKNMISK